MKKYIFIALLLLAVSPLHAQFFNGTETTTSTIHRTGNVGIGTSNPQMKLHISDSDRTGIQLGGPSTSTGAVADISLRPSDYGSVNNTKLWNFSYRTDTWAGNAGDLVVFSSNGSTYISPLILQSDGDVILADGASAGRKGNVGIGTLNPTAKLTVNGNILAEHIEVVSEITSDFVFEDDYNLRSLEEVEAYVKENKHLPEIPSAKELEGQTYSLGEMDDLLLRKIEELTLYIIDLQKEIQVLKDKEALTNSTTLKQ